jgi:hypothetical protein
MIWQHSNCWLLADCKHLPCSILFLRYFAEVPLSSQFWQLPILAITNSHRPLRIGELIPTKVGSVSRSAGEFGKVSIPFASGNSFQLTILVRQNLSLTTRLNPLRIGELIPTKTTYNSTAGTERLNPLRIGELIPTPTLRLMWTRRASSSQSPSHRGTHSNPC